MQNGYKILTISIPQRLYISKLLCFNFNTIFRLCKEYVNIIFYKLFIININIFVECGVYFLSYLRKKTLLANVFESRKLNTISVFKYQCSIFKINTQCSICLFQVCDIPDSKRA